METPCMYIYVWNSMLTFSISHIVHRYLSSAQDTWVDDRCNGSSFAMRFILTLYISFGLGSWQYLWSEECDCYLMQDPFGAHSVKWPILCIQHWNLTNSLYSQSHIITSSTDNMCKVSWLLYSLFHVMIDVHPQELSSPHSFPSPHYMSCYGLNQAYMVCCFPKWGYPSNQSIPKTHRWPQGDFLCSSEQIELDKLEKQRLILVGCARFCQDSAWLILTDLKRGLTHGGGPMFSILVA